MNVTVIYQHCVTNVPVLIKKEKQIEDKCKFA